MSRHELAEHLCQSEYGREVLDAYGTLDAPDAVWMTEVSTVDAYSQELKFGEVVIDPRVPQGISRSVNTMMLVSMHLPGFFIKFTRGVPNAAIFCDSDKPAQIYRRRQGRQEGSTTGRV